MKKKYEHFIIFPFGYPFTTICIFERKKVRYGRVINITEPSTGNRRIYIKDKDRGKDREKKTNTAKTRSSQ